MEVSSVSIGRINGDEGCPMTDTVTVNFRFIPDDQEGPLSGPTAEGVDYSAASHSVTLGPGVQGTGAYEAIRTALTLSSKP